MKLPYRTPLMSLSEEHMELLLSPYFGKKEDGSFFLGYGIGPGWSDIVYDLHKKLLEEVPDYRIHQVKEKFGGLRYYTSSMTDKGREYIREAEELSEKTCEECGRPGKLRKHSYWIRTLCSVDSAVDQANKHLWNIHKGGLKFFFKHYFAIRRLNKKRKESAEK